MNEPSCEGCGIVAGRVSTPGGVIFEDSYWHVTHIGEPVAFVRGMLLVRAKRHVVAIAEFTDEELTALGRVQRLMCRALQKLLAPERIYSVFFGEGSPHAHFVLVPRYADMPGGNAVKTLGDTIFDRKYVISEKEACATAQALRDALAELRSAARSADLS